MGTNSPLSNRKDPPFPRAERVEPKQARQPSSPKKANDAAFYLVLEVVEEPDEAVEESDETDMPESVRAIPGVGSCVARAFSLLADQNHHPSRPPSERDKIE